MNNRKNGYQKMEIMLEEILQENNIDNKIKEMEEKLKKISETEVRGKGSNKKEYEASLVEEQKKQDAKKAELEKKLKFYKGFAENKNSILNIREYQLQLQGRLEGLEQKKSDLDKVFKANEQANEKEQSIEDEIKDTMNKIAKIQQDLKNPDLSDKEKEKLEKDKKELTEKMAKSQDKYLKNQQLVNKNLDKKELKQIEKDILDTKIKISKCNMIWSTLLKGKSWDDISTILKTGKFTAKDENVNKIRRIVKEDIEQTIEAELAKNVKDILGGKLNNKEGKNKTEEEQNNLPVEVKPFEERHPKLAKIPFLSKFMNWREKRKESKQLKKDEKEQGTKTQSSEKEEKVDEKALKYIDKQMETKEEEMFKSIAEKGFKESIKFDVSEKLARQKVEAANEYAKKYGNKYKEQDGAEK